MNTVKDNPASTTGITGSLGILVALLAGVDNAQVVGAIGIALGLVPVAYTVIVRQGGLRGLVSKLWTGK